MCWRYKKRTTIVSEGDSWFAYPPKWLIAGKSSKGKSMDMQLKNGG
jgi:hypothetical protein